MGNEQVKTPRFSYNDIKDIDKFTWFHASCQNSKVFNWIVNKIKGKAQGRVQFWQKKTPNTKKIGGTKKEEGSVLNVEDLFLLTFIRLKIGTLELDLALDLKLHNLRCHKYSWVRHTFWLENLILKYNSHFKKMHKDIALYILKDMKISMV